MLYLHIGPTINGRAGSFLFREGRLSFLRSLRFLLSLSVSFTPRAPTLFPFSSFHLPSLSPFLSFLPSGLPRPCSSHAMFLLALGFRPFISLPGELFRVNNFCFIFASGNFTPGVVRIMVRISVVSRFSSPLAA